MNLANITFQSIRFLLLPFALLYAAAIWLRNQLYDKKVFSSASFNIPIICVGNLSVGGTGKSPMIEYLIRLLKEEYQLAILSRGYKRKTKGYALANENTGALEIGDEPMQFHSKFPEVAVAVGENRVEAIPQLLHDRPDTQVILLDDGFQHRAIKPGFSILLTDVNNLYTKDFYLPTGDLRDEVRSSRRADIIIATKCKPGFTEDHKKKITKDIRPLPHQQLFFSTIEYGVPQHILNTGQTSPLHKNLEVLLVTGIANIEPLKRYILENTYTYERMSFGDHHIFSIDDLNEIKKRFDKINAPHKIIITTEKDAVRLMKFHTELADVPLFVLPIQHKILFDEEIKFKQAVSSFIQNFYKEENNT
ncbi:MAG: tetraacyldisaccharide 4'-kinase [Chitinophagaceae bacterium]|nr:tetraacyldisaccharide 4'-kinase [Chitinophagaceae bacterium]